MAPDIARLRPRSAPDERSAKAELQERRQWLSRERFIEGLSLVKMLPGAAATQLGIFLGYAAFGATPLMKGALYGLGPVVLGIFLVAVWRLGKSAAATPARR